MSAEQAPVTRHDSWYGHTPTCEIRKSTIACSAACTCGVVDKCQRCSGFGPNCPCTTKFVEQVSATGVTRIGNQYYPLQDVRDIWEQLGEILKNPGYRQ